MAIGLTVPFHMTVQGKQQCVCFLRTRVRDYLTPWDPSVRVSRSYTAVLGLSRDYLQVYNPLGQLCQSIPECRSYTEVPGLSRDHLHNPPGPLCQCRCNSSVLGYSDRGVPGGYIGSPWITPALPCTPTFWDTLAEGSQVVR